MRIVYLMSISISISISHAVLLSTTVMFGVCFMGPATEVHLVRTSSRPLALKYKQIRSNQQNPDPVSHCPSMLRFFEARADAMVASPSFSKVPPMKHATLMAFPSAVSVTVSTGGLAALSSLAGTPSKNDLREMAFLGSNYPSAGSINKLSGRLHNKHVRESVHRVST